MHKVALFVAVVVVLACASRADAADRPLRAALRGAAAPVDWGNLTAHERVIVLRRWNRAPEAFDALLARVAPVMSMRRTVGSELAAGNFTAHIIGGDERAWRVHLSAAVLTPGSKLGAHITLHELGHVVDGVLAGDAWREAFVAALARSPLWRSCIPLPPGSSGRCVSASEIIADQFAFWATARREVRSSYWVPPLLRRAELGGWFERLLDEPAAPR